MNLDKQGFANYFGYQRFGKFGDNYKEGLEILRGKKMKNVKMKEFLISAFQSELFNRYLSKRVELSHFANDFSEKNNPNLKFLKKKLRSLKNKNNFLSF